MPRKTSRRTLSFFLRQLELTGNFALAADRAGVVKSGIHKRRLADPAFASACDAALAKFQSAQPKSAHPEEPLSNVEAASRRTRTTPGDVVMSTYAGRLQLRRLPTGRLTGSGVRSFLATLASTGNVRLSARAVGVAASSIYRRRWLDPAFGKEMDAAREIAMTRLHCAIIQAADRAFDPNCEWIEDINEDAPRMSVQEAIGYLRMHQSRGR